MKVAPVLFDLERARRETPGVENVLHFNNAGASLMPQPVLDATIDFYKLEAQMGGYEAARKAKAQIDGVYDDIALLIGANSDEIAIVENATRAWDMAFYSIPFSPGDKILTAVSEYASNYIAFLQVAKRTGAQVEVVPNDEYGQISISALSNAIDSKVKLIAITHIPTNGGLVNPAHLVGKVARKSGILYLLDACQSVGQMPVDVNEIRCDMLSATSRKYLRGPRGMGFLYIKRDVVDKLEPPFLDLHAATWTEQGKYEIRPGAKRFENWESNIACKIGLGTAVKYARSWGLDLIWSRVSSLANNLRERLSGIPRVKVQDLGETKCGIVSFTVDGKEAADIQQELSKHNINANVSRPPSTLLDAQARKLPNLLRASVHYYNSEEEVEIFCKVLEQVIK